MIGTLAEAKIVCQKLGRLNLGIKTNDEDPEYIKWTNKKKAKHEFDMALADHFAISGKAYRKVKIDQTVRSKDVFEKNKELLAKWLN